MSHANVTSSTPLPPVNHAMEACLEMLLAPLAEFKAYVRRIRPDDLDALSAVLTCATNHFGINRNELTHSTGLSQGPGGEWIIAPAQAEPARRKLLGMLEAAFTRLSGEHRAQELANLPH